MLNTQPIYSLSICTQVTMNMHSLNNEGGEGNQIQTRMVNIMGEDGYMYNVNAVSGDMFKHIQAEHLHRLSLDANLPLSDGARSFNANRVNFDIEAKTNLFHEFKKVKDKDKIKELDIILKHCAVTDMEGTLVTADNRSLARKSVVEFGWAVGLPNKVETDSYFHAKYVHEHKTSKKSDDTGDSSGSNVGQNIFHRPASSGIYAIVLNIEAARIGFNDLAQRYAIDEVERAVRLKTLLESVLYTFIEPAGAMRSTQNPHIVNLNGVITVSHNVIPAPCISPLKESFVDDINKVSSAFNGLRPDAIKVIRFSSIGEFASELAGLIPLATPYTLDVAQTS
ncbi:MAG: DevR family CRISPR-associated autoregulator [Chloroflexota bacterium]